MANKTKPPQKLRRNERERNRVHMVNEGFNVLRNRVPKITGTKAKLSKVDTLREAARYIRYLHDLLAREAAATQTNGCQPETTHYQPPQYYQPAYQDVSPSCESNYYGSASDSSSYDEQMYTSSDYSDIKPPSCYAP